MITHDHTASKGGQDRNIMYINLYWKLKLKGYCIVRNTSQQHNMHLLSFPVQLLCMCKHTHIISLPTYIGSISQHCLLLIEG